MHTRIVVLFACLGTLATGCKRSSTYEYNGPATKQLDACQLLTSQEIAAVQGSAIKDSKGSEQTNGRVRNSQCYFGAEESNRSVSLTVTQPDSAGGEKGSARKTWGETFGRFGKAGGEEDKESEAERDKKESLREQKGKGEEEDEKAAPPRKIEDLGDEAYWSGSRVGGALYVLKNDVYLRISLGGPDPEEVRIEKSKKLLQKALDRLP